MTQYQMESCVPELETVRAFLQAHAHIKLQDFRLRRIHTHPSKGLRLLYRAHSDGEGNREYYFSARSMPSTIGRTKERKINQQFCYARERETFGGFTQAAYYSQDLHALFQIFPADRRLPFLINAANPAFMKKVFADLYQEKCPSQVLSSLAISPIQYKPERKCLFRYRLNWEGTAGQGEVPPIVYGKSFRKAKRVYNNLVKIFAAQECGTFRIPQPLAFCQSLHMELLGHVPGRHLSKLCFEHEFPALCRTIGQGLAEFHEASVVVEERRDPMTDMVSVHQWGNEFAEAYPRQAGLIRYLAQEIYKALPTHDTQLPKLVHGDFHVANILVDGRNLGLLDFENCYMGNPAADVGSFYAQLKLLALKVFQDHAALDAGLHSFLDGYLNQCNGEYRFDVRTFAALGCLWCAYFQCIRRPEKSGWLERAETLLGIAEGLLTRKGLV